MYGIPALDLKVFLYIVKKGNDFPGKIASLFLQCGSRHPPEQCNILRNTSCVFTFHLIVCFGLVTEQRVIQFTSQNFLCLKPSSGIEPVPLYDVKRDSSERWFFAHLNKSI